ncbi:MAG: winged helix-turn-helix transcriptional regulator [Acidobacteria bacterium]|nr:winged helix-turn-helix transcriptional regulator [Acidobacteriota bacterium]
MESGWTAIPSIILEKQQALRLDPLDLNILLQLARYWWVADKPPYPSVQTIAESVGKSRSTVQLRIREMEKDGLIRRVPRYHSKGGGQQTNAYRFDGLIEAATPFAEEKQQLEKEKESADRRRLRRKRPKHIRLVEE